MLAINLLPWRQARREQFKHQFLLRILAVVGLASLEIVSSHLWLTKMAAIRHQNNRALRDANTRLNQQTRIFNQLITQQQTLKSRLELLKHLEKNRDLPTKLLSALVNIMPGKILLTRIQYHPNTVILTGLSPSNVDVSVLLDRLNRLAFLRTVNLSTLSTIANSQLGSQQFVITAGLT